MFYSPLFRKFRRDNPTLTLRQALALYAEVAHWCDEIEHEHDHAISTELPPRDASGRFMARESDLPHALDPDALDHLPGDPERMTGATSLGAAWCAPDPIFAAYVPDPRSYAGTWEGGVRVGGDHRLDRVVFEESDDPEQDIVWWDPDFDFDDRAYERERRGVVAGRLQRFASLVPDDEAVDEIAQRDRTGKVERILRACEENPEAFRLIKADLAARAETVVASDEEPVGLGMRYDDLLPLLYVLLTSLHANALENMGDLNERERRDKDLVSACWADFNAFTRDIHKTLVRARIIIPPPPDRSRQFAALEAWAREPNLSRREAFLRLWRMRVISIACDLADTECMDEHANPRHVVWLSHRESPYEASGVNHDAIRRLLEGHPSAQVQALAHEFQDAFELIHTSEQEAEERAAAAAWASRLVDVTVAPESPEDVYASLLDEL